MNEPFQDLHIQPMEGLHAFPVEQALGIVQVMVERAIPISVFNQLQLQPCPGGGKFVIQGQLLGVQRVQLAKTKVDL